MVAQGVLGFQYEADSSNVGLTSLAGLPLYLDLNHASGFDAAIRRQVQVAGAGLVGHPLSVQTKPTPVQRRAFELLDVPL
jgi:hypothetical protein